MRKGFIILTVLLLISIGGAIYVSADLKNSITDVKITEDIIEGDRSAADGISLKLQSFFEDDIQWESTVSFENGEMHYGTAATMDRDVPGRRFRERKGAEVHLEDITEARVNGEPLFGSESVKNKYDGIMAELTEGLNPGESVSRRIYLSELYDYYPFSTWISMPEGTTLGSTFSTSASYDSNSVEARFCRKMEEYFRIPVLPNDYIAIGYTQGGGSTVVINPLTDGDEDEYRDHFEFSTFDRTVGLSGKSLSTEDAVYFWFTNKTRSGAKVDTSLIPGGYGIYRLPYGYVTGKGYQAFADELSTVCRIDEDADIIGVQLSEDQTKLIIIMNEGTQLTVSVADIATGEYLRHLVLEENCEYISNEIYGGKGAVIYCNGDNSFGSVFVSANGECSKGFTFNVMNRYDCRTEYLDTDITFEHKGRCPIYYPAVSYDGDRLAVCFVCDAGIYKNGDDSLASGYEYELIVCSEEGTGYRAILSPSNFFANQVIDGAIDEPIRPFYTDSVIIN